MGNICNRLSHTYAPHLQSANVSYSMQKRLFFNIGYVSAKLPVGGGGYDHLVGSLIYKRSVFDLVFFSSKSKGSIEYLHLFFR